MDYVQEDRKKLLKQMCHEEDLMKKPKLHHLLVDDAHRIIYCYVPKVSVHAVEESRIYLQGS